MMSFSTVVRVLLVTTALLAVSLHALPVTDESEKQAVQNSDVVVAVEHSKNSSRAVTAAGTASHGTGADKVYLRSITALVFSQNGRTRSQTGRARAQLSCVGGSAAGFFWGADRYPRIVQCENIGWDGASIQWRCHAELKEGLEFGDTVVQCEGYDFPGDEYIYRGSCRLEYTLNYSHFQLSFMHVVYGSVLAIGMLWAYYQSRFHVHQHTKRELALLGIHDASAYSRATYQSIGTTQ